MKNFSLSSMFDTCFNKKSKKKTIPIELTNYKNRKTDTKKGIRLDQESQWTRGEKQLFWNIISSHIRNLLLRTTFSFGFDTEYHNLIDIYFSKLNPISFDDFCRCREIIRRNLWRGEYRKAVVHYLLTKEFFYILFPQELNVDEEVKELQSIYFNAYYIHTEERMVL